MKQLSKLGGILLGSALVLPATQRVMAAVTQVTDVQLNPTANGVDVVLKTSEGEDSKESVISPQIFTVSRGNELTADLPNTQLSLPQGESFRQENPAPGIASIVVNQQDANSIRVIVSGEDKAPSGEVSSNKERGITLSVNPVAGTTKAALPTPNDSAPVKDPLPEKAAPIAQAAPPLAPLTPAPLAPAPLTPAPLAPAPFPGQAAPALPVVPPAQPVITTPNPDVLVPNPKITIDGVPAPAAGAVQPVTAAPPFLPRAIAPPVGDITISNTNAAPTVIDLGTAERVPRLVLRDAPVREVLGLLARSAGLNLAFTGAAAQGQPGQPAPAPGGATPESGPTISLDIENEPVQDVFNTVLQLSGLEANRVGNTIFVGARLPDDARNVIARSIRLNQVPVTAAANFLTAQGAETQIPTEQIQIQTIGEGAAARTVEIRTPSILALRATEGNAPLLLKGVAVSTDDRLNSITLVGTPRKVEIATNLLTQLDARRRQVAVNVKIVDVNLLNTSDLGTSFSFGIGDSFFSIDRGAAAFNYGGVTPPTNAQVTGSLFSPTVIQSPFQGDPFLDAQPNAPFGTGTPQPFASPINQTGNVQGFPQPITDNLGNVIGFSTQPGVYGRAPFGTNRNPLQPGITDFTLGTSPTTTVTIDPTTGRQTTQVTPGTPGTFTYSLPSLFQFPSRFLSALRAQIQSGNAKILTDPTLVVQEGQRAVVNLTQEVFGGTETTFVADAGGNQVPSTRPIIKQAGLILDISVNRIDDNGFVSLAVSPTVSSVGGSQNTPLGVITLLQSRQLNSGEIRLRDGQTLILSGIIQESDRTTVSKVPILGDIPILGALFRSTNRQNQRQEVIVLLTPQILDDAARSSFGYSYTPGQNARQLLERRGSPVPNQ